MLFTVSIRKFFFLRLISVLFSSGEIFSQENSSEKNLLYASYSGAFLYGSFSLNYERILHKNFSLSAGYGYGYWSGYLTHEGGFDAGYSATLMANFISGRPENKTVEIGAGITYLHSGYFRGTETKILPAASVGYRFNFENNFFIRAGLCYEYYYGFPLYVSTGFRL